MQVKKVFSVDSKKMCSKPAYVKPKYKTYRELLDLDRPKKIIQHDSDGENDDFLEKLMKKEERKKKQEKQKEKQKKQSANSKNLSQAPSSQKNKKEAPSEKQNNLLQKENPRISSGKSNANQDNESVDFLQKKNETEEIMQNRNTEERKNITQAYEDDQTEGIQDSIAKSTTNKKQSIKVVIKKRNSSQSNLLSNAKLQTVSKSHTKFTNEEQSYDTLIRLSQNQVNKIIKNTFFTSHKLRKTVGLKQLQRNTHQQISNIKDTQNLIETKLNPEKRVIKHTISPQKLIKENQVSYSQRARDFLFKSATASPLQMVLMANKSVGNLQSKYKTQMIARKSLFKSSYQEELFLKSLKKN